ncbi:MAG: DNA polymerase domain-containing protein [Candidatus Bathyarchaeia archaeon]
MKVNFWLLDIDREEENGKTIIRLWGITDKNERIVIYDKTFYPSFYLLIKNEFTEDFLKELEQKKDSFRIVSILKEEKKFFGRKVKAIKLTFNSFEDLTKCSKQLTGRIEIDEVLEDDLRPAFKYMIEKNIVPCCWHEIEVKEGIEEKPIMIDKVYEAVSSPNLLIEKKDIPPLKVLSFNVTCYSKLGSPNPLKDPVILISICTNFNDEKQFSAFDFKDEKVISDFSKFINEFDPDVIVGFNNNNFDWPYLIERAKINKMNLSVTREGFNPHKSLYGHISITGRANIDLLDFAKDVPEIKLETLEELVDFLKIKFEGKLLISNVARYIETEEEKKVLLKDSLTKAKLILECFKMLSEFFIQLSSVTGIPLDQVITTPVGFRVDSYLIRQAHKLGELISKRKEQMYQSYKGGVVLSPKPGLHKNIAVLDFASMYPNLMILYNVSPDTLVSSNELNENVFSIPEVEHKFRKEPPGLYKIVFLNLLTERKKINEQLKQLPPESIEYKLLKERSKAIKIITNACYGYAGWIGARWYSKEVAESATALGRKAIKEVMQIAEEEDLKVIYSDTDSIFVENLPEKIKKLQEKTLSRIGVEIKIDKIYKKIVFTEAKKKYAGLTQGNTIDIVGMEAVRGDWVNIAKLTQRKILEIMLIEENLEKALDYLKNLIKKLRKEKGELKDFILWKTLTKPISEYEVKAPHIEAAKKLIQKGWRLTPGDKIGYIIVKGSGKLYEKAEPYEFANIEDIDIEYYIFHQVIPVSSRILKVFGIPEKRLIDLATTSLINFSF